jgi:steroid 5-alpha reductase family enzyme
VKNRTLQNALSIVACIAVGSAIAAAGSQGSVLALGVPLFALCAGISFGVNWLAFIPAYAAQTEHFYDLLGSLTYLALVGSALALGETTDSRALLLAGLVAIWATRLGSFLFLRVRREGSDGRFDRIKPDFARFLMAWTLQALWVFLTLSCALAAITSATSVALAWPAALGTAVWLAGFGIEVAADRQKSAFRADPANRGRFITTGLWAWSRHPNYFGEIALWAGIAIIALPALSGWQLATLISPAFVFVLLTRISGVPLLEARGNKRWGEDTNYKAYKARTSVLVPRPPASPQQ